MNEQGEPRFPFGESGTIEEKYLRVANYCANMNKEIDMIAHSCGCRQARELKREHVRVVQSVKHSIALNMLYPYPVVGVRLVPRAIETIAPAKTPPALRALKSPGQARS